MDRRRYYGLDALRGVMMMLGIVIHAAMFYTVMTSEVVPLKDRQTWAVFDVVVGLIHAFRMPSFFLLAGFFAALLVEKYGFRGALTNRLKRVLLPLLIGLFTVLPITGWFLLSFKFSVDHDTKLLLTSLEGHRQWAQDFERQLGGPSPGHLWFLYYLMMFYLLTPLCEAGLRSCERRGWAARLQRVTASRWLPVVLGAWTALTLWPHKGGLVVGFQHFTPHLPSLVYYGSFFFVGYSFHRYRAFLVTSERHLGGYALVSALLFVVSLAPAAVDYQEGGRTAWLHWVTISLHGVLTWVLVYAFVGLFQRYLDHDSPWVAYISQSSYWVYLVHLPVVSIAAWYLLDSELPAMIKFLLVGSFTTVVAFSSYHYLVRRTFVSVLLNGRRFSLGWPWLERGDRPYSSSMYHLPDSRR
jgi:glucan biosynthesis protein C